MSYSALSVKQLQDERNLLRAQLALKYQTFKSGGQIDKDGAQNLFDKVMEVQEELLKQRNAPSGPEQEKNNEALRQLLEIKNDSAPVKPKVKIQSEKVPHFGGEFHDYAIFKRIFTSIIDKNPDYDDDDKERYLLAHVNDKARDLVTPFIGKNDSYKSMWKALSDEFEKPENIKDHLKAEIEKLPSVQGRYDEKLTEFKDSVKRIKNAASQHVNKSDDFNNTILSLLIGKFNYTYRNKLTMDCANIDDLIKKMQKWHDEKERLQRSGMFHPNRERNQSKKPFQNYKPKSTAMVAMKKNCVLCQGNHANASCTAEMNSSERKVISSRNRLCFMCLEPGHRVGDIKCTRAKESCGKCGWSHHKLICVPAKNQNQNENQNPSHTKPLTVSSGVALSWKKEMEKVVSLGAAMIDGCLEGRPFFTAIMNGRRIKILLDTGSDRTLVRRCLLNSQEVIQGETIIIDGVGGLEPTNEVAKFYIASEGVVPIGFYGYVMNRLPGDVDIVIGKDDIPLLLKPEALIENKAYFDTVFGRVKYGYVDSNPCDQVSSCVVNSVFADVHTDIKDLIMTELELMEKEVAFDLHVHQMEGGRYEADLPFLPGPRPRNNFFQAERRLDQLIRRLNKTPGLLPEYREQLFAYEKDGFAILLNDCAEPWKADAFFMPHQEVIKEERETSKFRVVFDASAGKCSLNEKLYKGDAESLRVFESVMNFRSKPVAVLADIEKAFLQIEISEEYRKYLRFLWKEDDRLYIFEMWRVPFGLVSSPAILMAVIRKQIDKYREIYPDTASMLSGSFYMDDLTVSVETKEQAMQLQTESIEVFKDAKFNLRKWKTNDPELQRQWKQEPDSSCKVLGVNWDTKSDSLSLGLEQQNCDVASLTMRNMMKFIGSIFDPIGIVEPVKLRLKEMLREVIKSGVGWDEPIPNGAATEFGEIINQMDLLTKVQIPRHVPSSELLSIFCDASDRGYGFVVFVTDNENKNYYLYSKSRLSPIKKRTTPELELSALTEAVENIPLIRKYYPSSEMTVIVWSDSSITLGRLDNDVNKYGTYVGNRLVRIRKVCEQYPTKFRYISTKCNPGDVYSRPKSVKEFIKLKPYKLELNVRELISQAEAMNLPKVDLNCAAVNVKQPKLKELPGFERASEWPVMVKWAKTVIQLCFRLVKYQREATVQDAITYLYHVIQHESIEELKSVKLPHFTDEKGVIRIRTRNSNDYPIWIPYSSRAAKLIVRHCHLKAMHMRRRFTKAIVNETYYIAHVNKLIDQVLKTCTTCQKIDRRRIKQPTGDLPYFRVREYGPFECVGVDYFGPIQLKGRKKCWCLIVTCSVSRAVHLEIVQDMTAASCLAALNATFNVRGLPQIIVSDNGTNFTRAEKDLRKLIALTKEAKDSVIEFDIKWYFDPPRASWWGGWFEIMVGTVKHALRKVNGVPNIHQLRFVLLEIMSIVNSRPLFPEDSEKDNFITPGHYLIGRSFKSIPSGFGRIDSFKILNQVKRWRKRFLRFWKSEYLRQLGLRYENIKRKNIKVGDLVLVQEDEVKDKWTMARIESIEAGPDGVIRTVTILYPDGSKNKTAQTSTNRKQGNKRKILMRAVQNLVKLELDQPQMAGAAECEGFFAEPNVQCGETLEQSASDRGGEGECGERSVAHRP